MIICPSFPDHWKTRYLIKQVGAEGVLALLRLWGHCQYRKSQSFEGNAAVVAAIALWDGDPQTLENALLEAKLANRDGNLFTLHDWEKYNARLMTASERGKKGGRPKTNTTENDEKPNPRKPNNRKGMRL